MNKYPLWKYILLGVVLLVGFIFALPNLFGDDQAVQIASRSSSDPTLEAGFEEHARTILTDAGFNDFRVRRDGERVLALFDNPEDQLRAKDTLDEQLNAESRQYVIALNLVSAAPAWFVDSHSQCISDSIFAVVCIS